MSLLLPVRPFQAGAMGKTYLATKSPCWNQTFAKPCTAVLAAFAAAKDGRDFESASRLSAAIRLSVRSALSQQPSRCVYSLTLSQMSG